VRLGVASLLAFFPQPAFYAIENDILSPVSSGVAFLFLIHFWRTETLSFRLAVAIGLSLAATFFDQTHQSAVAGGGRVAIAFQAWHWAREAKTAARATRAGPAGRLRRIAIVGWMAWMKHNFGDFTGESAHVLSQGWTRKPFSEWWHHPIFTPSGFWTYLSTLLASFWMGKWSGMVNRWRPIF